MSENWLCFWLVIERKEVIEAVYSSVRTSETWAYIDQVEVERTAARAGPVDQYSQSCSSTSTVVCDEYLNVAPKRGERLPILPRANRHACKVRSIVVP